MGIPTSNAISFFGGSEGSPAAKRILVKFFHDIKHAQVMKVVKQNALYNAEL